MHNCEVAPPPVTGANLLLELGELIVHSRGPSPPPPPLDAVPNSLPPPATQDRPATSAPDDGFGRLLQAKLLAARSFTPELPSTSKETSEEIFRRSFKIKDLEGWAVGRAAPGLDAAAVGEAVTKAQRALYLDSQLNTHVQALWSERVPIHIDVLLTSGCQHCGGGAGGGAGEALLLERWSLALKAKKSVEKPSFITSQWLLNAVRSQLHFSQISAWRAKLRGAAPEAAADPQERQRRRSREKCNYKKLESNCDEAELGSGHDYREDKEARKLNIIYRPGLGGEASAFQRPPTVHRFPLTDIAADFFLEVLLESLPRTEEVPTIKCTCSAVPKRRMSKDNTIHEELASRMNDLSLGPPDHSHNVYRTEGATFSPDLGLINSNIGYSSGISRKLSIFSTGEYAGARGPTPERQSNSSGYAHRSSPSEDRKNIQLDHPYFDRNLSVRNEVRANYLLLDDRMHTPCSENGKHRCSCDEESDHSRESNGVPQSSSAARHDDGRRVSDERRLKEIAKYKRRLRKESKLKKMRDSGTSDSAGTSESTDRSPEKEKEEAAQTTSIPILQASRFDPLRTIGRYRNRAYLTLPTGRGEERCRDAACDAPAPRAVACASTQTDAMLCACGRSVDLECGECGSRMVRSLASYDLTRVAEVLEASRKPCARRKEMDDVRGDEKVMKKHKCDNNDRNSKCDLSFSDLKESAIRKCPEDAANAAIVKRPKLRRVLPVAEKMSGVLADRRRAESAAADMSQLLLKDDDSVFASATPTHERKASTRSSVGDDEYFLYEKCDYGTFDRFDNPESLVRDESDDDRKEAKPDAASSAKASRVKGLELAEVPSPSEMEGFRWRLDSAASMVFHARTGLPLTSSPAPLRRGKSCFDYDSSITDISGIKSALFHPVSPPEGWWSPGSSPGSPAPLPASPPPAPLAAPPPPRRPRREPRIKMGPTSGLLGTFEESALNGRLEPVATVHGFTAELGASGAFCPPHRRLPVTVFFYALGGTNAPYLGHINLGSSGYRIPRSGTVQVSLFNPHGTLVKMFVVLYELTEMPACARTFLRQRTLYVPCDVTRAPPSHECYRWLRYLIHLRFLTSKTGKLYLHTDIRIIVSRKADLDTATAHSPVYNQLAFNGPTNRNAAASQPANGSCDIVKASDKNADRDEKDESKTEEKDDRESGRPVNRVFGGCEEVLEVEQKYDYNSAKSDRDFLAGKRMNRSEACMELKAHCENEGNGENVSYELRSFTYAPDNPKYSPL